VQIEALENRFEDQNVSFEIRRKQLEQQLHPFRHQYASSGTQNDMPGDKNPQADE